MRTRITIIITLAFLLAIHTTKAQDSLLVIKHLSYSLLFNEKHHVPSVVTWDLSVQDLGRYSKGQHINFKEDPATKRPRVNTASYRNTGYHRGHLCPAGDRGSTIEKWRDTFFMSNVAPMQPRLNTGAWKAAEDECRAMVSTGCDLRITAIPLWLDSIAPDFGNPPIRVPSHFYKCAHCFTHPGHVIHWLFRNTQERQDMQKCVITTTKANAILQGVMTGIYKPKSNSQCE